MPTYEAVIECRSCGEEKTQAHYNFRPDGYLTYGRICSPCRRAKKLAWEQENPERVTRYRREASRRHRLRNPHRSRNDLLKYKYGLTPERFEEMLTAQEGKCAICRRPPRPGKPFSIDHDHETGRVRGLLCQFCNVMLGFIEGNGLLGHVDDAVATYLGNGLGG